MHETIGLQGGSFNPIHNGHLAMAQAARDTLHLSRLIILPDGDPPHKAADLADKYDRLRMCELAAAGRFEVSAMEVERPGKTYTVDTLEALHSLYPQAVLYMIIGADTLHQLMTWKNPRRVFALCRFAVFGRDGLPLIDIEGAVVERMDAQIPDVSSTDIRARVHRGQSLEGLVPEAVAEYIGARRLYAPPTRASEQAIRAQLQKSLPPGRYRHILSVQKTLRGLAERWGYDVRKASLAGLLHDCAKGMTLPEMQAYVDAQGEWVDGMRRTTGALLHAPASAAMARATFGVTDPEILHAIWYHNTGSAEYGLLDQLLWIADMDEPRRKDFPGLAELRKLSMEDLDAATRMVLRLKMEHVEERAQDAHPDTAAALAAIEKKDEKEGDA